MPGSSTSQKLVAIFVAEETPRVPQAESSSLTLKRLSIDELKQQSDYVLSPTLLKLLVSMHESNTVYPCSVLECFNAEGRQRAAGMEKEEEETDGVQTLEEQMLQQSGYGPFGELQQHTLNMVYICRVN